MCRCFRTKFLTDNLILKVVSKFMGRDKRSKYKQNLKQQVLEKLQSKMAIGESKHKDKINGVDTTDKIYSLGSYRTYAKQCIAFTKWIEKAHPEVTTLKKAKHYIHEFLNHQKSKGLSAWTITTQAQSLNKLYGIKAGDSDFYECPTRNRADIMRSRYIRDIDKHYSTKNNYELTTFCRSTGLRRSEIQALKGNEAVTRQQLEKRATEPCTPKIAKIISDALSFPKYEYFVFVRSGKGGRPRLAPIIGNNAKTIYEKIKTTPKADKVFPHVHHNADIHSFRGDYANTIYNDNARPIDTIPYDKVDSMGRHTQSEVYKCRKDRAGISLDRVAMQYTSKALGHNRIDIVANSYLRF